jgi:hypothetical protein
LNASRKKPDVAFWATAVAVVMLAYAISFVPACWLVDGGMLAARPVAMAYRPILSLVGKHPPLWSAAVRCTEFGSTHPERAFWTLTRLRDAAGLIVLKRGFGWPDDMHEDIPHRSSDRF